MVAAIRTAPFLTFLALILRSELAARLDSCRQHASSWPEHVTSVAVLLRELFSFMIFRTEDDTWAVYRLSQKQKELMEALGLSEDEYYRRVRLLTQHLARVREQYLDDFEEECEKEYEEDFWDDDSWDPGLSDF